ncbi:MAG: hypothetical protein H7836_16825, partial [Magnetococcus sp. YQC-3]
VLYFVAWQKVNVFDPSIRDLENFLHPDKRENASMMIEYILSGRFKELFSGEVIKLFFPFWLFLVSLLPFAFNRRYSCFKFSDADASYDKIITKSTKKSVLIFLALLLWSFVFGVFQSATGSYLYEKLLSS